jgi:hypothetical protein
MASGRVGAVTFLQSCRHCSQWVAQRLGWSKPRVGIATPEARNEFAVYGDPIKM